MHEVRVLGIAGELCSLRLPEHATVPDRLRKPLERHRFSIEMARNRAPSRF